MSFIDTHTHLYAEEFDVDRAAVVERAVEAGAVKLLLPCIDEASIEPMLQMQRDYPDLCFAMMGLQPEELPDDPDALLDRMEQRLDTEDYIAVGEVGLDYYWDASRKEEQCRVFEREMHWAIDRRLPLVIHCRSAHNDLLRIMRPERGHLSGGIFHCFSGSPELAQELLRFPDFYLGIGGVVTFKNSKLGETLRTAVPLERLVVETDAPYLAPTPHRGQRNEPAYIPLVIARLPKSMSAPSPKFPTFSSPTPCVFFPRWRN